MYIFLLWGLLKKGSIVIPFNWDTYKYTEVLFVSPFTEVDVECVLLKEVVCKIF